MAILNVTPTRSNLSSLKARLVTSSRGHKLLKDKQDELMRQFIELIRQNRVLRDEVEEKLSDSFKNFFFASSTMTPEMLESSVSYAMQDLSVDIDVENIMGVQVPKMSFNTQGASEDSLYPYGYVHTSAELDDAIFNLNSVMESLLELAEVEKTAQLMADEIESTRRRVNALEYRTIPDLEETIKHIQSKLDEAERANITRLMKTKDIIAKNANEAKAEEDFNPVNF